MMASERLFSVLQNMISAKKTLKLLIISFSLNYSEKTLKISSFKNPPSRPGFIDRLFSDWIL
jgi:hypothetical protein